MKHASGRIQQTHSRSMTVEDIPHITQRNEDEGEEVEEEAEIDTEMMIEIDLY